MPKAEDNGKTSALIIDDNTTNLELLTNILESAGVSVTELENGADVLPLIQWDKIHGCRIQSRKIPKGEPMEKDDLFDASFYKGLQALSDFFFQRCAQRVARPMKLWKNILPIRNSYAGFFNSILLLQHGDLPCSSGCQGLLDT